MSADPPGLMLSLTLGVTEVMLHLIRHLTIFFYKITKTFYVSFFLKRAFLAVRWFRHPLSSIC